MKTEEFNGRRYKPITEPVIGKVYYFRHNKSNIISLPAFYLGKDLTCKCITQANAMSPVCLFDYCYELVLTPKEEIEAIIADLKADKSDFTQLDYIITYDQILGRLEQLKEML